MKQPALKPLHDRILLTPEPKTDAPGMVGGVHLPENFQMPRLNTGKVRHITSRVQAVGPDCKVVKVGDTVVVVDNATYEVTVEGETHLMVDEKQVLAVVG